MTKRKRFVIALAVVFMATSSAAAGPDHLPPDGGVPIVCAFAASVCDLSGVCIVPPYIDCPPNL